MVRAEMWRLYVPFILDGKNAVGVDEKVCWDRVEVHLQVRHLLSRPRAPSPMNVA